MNMMCQCRYILTLCRLVIQSCPTLCDPVDCSSIRLLCHGILQAEHWGGLPFPSPGDLPNPGTEPRPSALQADSLPSEPPGKSILTVVREVFHVGSEAKWVFSETSFQIDCEL